MLTIIHGEDIAASRNYFKSLQKAATEITLLQGSDVTITDLAQVFQGGSLFQESKEVFIEELIMKRKSPDELKMIAKIIASETDTHVITLWESKELTKTQLNLFKDAVVRIFKLPQSLFQFLDALKPGNGEKLVSLFHETLKASEAELIFFMLIRQTRLLLALHDGEANIDEVKRMAPWQKSKLQKQSHLFTAFELKKLFAKLGSIDIGMKTGQLPLPLLPQIDILLLET